MMLAFSNRMEYFLNDNEDRFFVQGLSNSLPKICCILINKIYIILQRELCVHKYQIDSVR